MSKKAAIEEITPPNAANKTDAGMAELSKQIKELQSIVQSEVGDTAGADINKVVGPKIISNEAASLGDPGDPMSLNGAFIEGLATTSVADNRDIKLPDTVRAEFDQINHALSFQDMKQKGVLVGTAAGQLVYPMDVITKPNKLYPKMKKDYVRKRADLITYALFGGTPAGFKTKGTGLGSRVIMAAAKDGFDKTLLWVSQKMWLFFATNDLVDEVIEKSRDYSEMFDRSESSPIVRALNECLAANEVRQLCAAAKYNHCAVTDILRHVIIKFVEAKEEDGHTEGVV
jgi:hypothetical protein